MRKLLSLILALVMIATIAIPTFAAVVSDDVIANPQYTYIQTASASISIDESIGIASCRATCYTISGYTVEIRCKLQKYSGTSWSTLKTWTASGTQYASVNKDWAVSRGYTYRVYATYYVRNSSGTIIETTSGNKTYVYS